jgi:hypothetical protein
MDEFEELRGRRSEFDRDFFAGLRALSQQGLSILTCSQKPLSELTEPGDPSSPFYNTFPILRLGGFAEKDAEDFVNLYREGVPGFSDAEKHAILGFARGHPLALQVACYYIVNGRHEGRPLSDCLETAFDDTRALLPDSFAAAFDEMRALLVPGSL